MELSQRAKNISPSATLKAAALAKNLKEQGRDIISLTVGEPDFVTPKNIQEKAIAAIQSGAASFYTPATGLLVLKEAVKETIKKEYALDYDTNHILVTPGAKFSLYAAFACLLNEGDEVLIPVPFWVSYEEQVKLVGGVPVFVQPKDQVTKKITPKDLEQVVTEKTKILLINSPSNPTGMIYTKEELTALGVFALQHNIFIVADDIYSRLIYHGNTFSSMVMTTPEIRENCLIVTGVSKTYAMTGWRIGFAFGPEKLIKAMSNLQSHTTSNPTTVSQYAALEALLGKQENAFEMQDEFAKRLDKAYNLVRELPGFSLEKPQGAFYLFPKVTEAMKLCQVTDVDEFVSLLLEETGVAVVSGRSFGDSQAIRISYAVHEEVFQEAMERILAFLQNKRLK